MLSPELIETLLSLTPRQKIEVILLLARSLEMEVVEEAEKEKWRNVVQETTEKYKWTFE
jgi:hypothetical protein